ncbi:MAG: class I SAM-dependent methyltransferase [Solirubrobacteraceae bacterium]
MLIQTNKRAQGARLRFQDMEHSAHRQRIERAFTGQADAFEDRARNRVFTSDASWVFDHLPRAGDELAIDVAAGTGHAARQLAPSVRAVVALDATAAMLARGREQARREQILNVVFMQGDAAALPFLDGSFDIAVCRFAAHHFERPEAVVAELARCTRTGGHVALVDLIAADDAGLAAQQNRLERLRDESHARMLARGELVELLGAAGLQPVDVSTRALRRPLEPWLDQAATGDDAAAEIRRTLRSELAGGEPTGFAPTEIDGRLMFTQTFAACISRLTDS